MEQWADEMMVRRASEIEDSKSHLYDHREDSKSSPSQLSVNQNSRQVYEKRFDGVHLTT